MTNVRGITLPLNVVDFLFDAAGRNLSKEEWKFLTSWQNTVRQGILDTEPKDSEVAKVEPPFDPTSEKAKTNRERRAAKRAAIEAKKRLETTPESVDTVDNTTEG